MSSKTMHQLTIGKKIELLVAIFNRQKIRRVLDRLNTKELVEAHNFIWDKLVELHYLTQRKEFVREEITKKMMSSVAYQRQQGCDLRIDYCKGVECIWSNPICAGNKIKNNTEVIAQSITRLLDSPHELGHDLSFAIGNKLAEVKDWL
ncbi:MAG: hypothetical protein ACE5HO_19860 [bacterium]